MIHIYSCVHRLLHTILYCIFFFFVHICFFFFVIIFFFFFFFQAEDGIRDWSVTGVQTCALPICFRSRVPCRTGHHSKPIPSHLLAQASPLAHVPFVPDGVCAQVSTAQIAETVAARLTPERCWRIRLRNGIRPGAPIKPLKASLSNKTLNDTLDNMA